MTELVRNASGVGGGFEWLSLSSDGQLVAFSSLANNYPTGIFVLDRLTGETERVSGASANNGSRRPSLSSDGQVVAFSSNASNLVPGDGNRTIDIFFHDRATGETERLNAATYQGTSGSLSLVRSLSSDGKVAVISLQDIIGGEGEERRSIGITLVHDRATGETEQVDVASDGSLGDGQSFTSSLSSDGRVVTFSSIATNLVPGDTNGTTDIFVHDRATGATERVSVASDGGQANSGSLFVSLSSDGQVVAFGSRASNLVPGDTD